MDQKRCGTGFNAQVFKSTLKTDRLYVRLKAGALVATRTSYRYQDFEDTMRTFMLAKKLRENNLSLFFPSFYGAYETKREEEEYHIEMEWVDKIFTDLYKCTYARRYEVKEMKRILPRVIFEFCLGEWTARYYCNIGSEDAKPDNWAIKSVDFNRVFKIGFNNKNYEFVLGGRGLPMRIDLGEAGAVSKDQDMTKRFVCSLSEYVSSTRELGKCLVTKEAIKFLEELQNPVNKSVFDVFEKFYKLIDPGEKHKRSMKFLWDIK